MKGGSRKEETNMLQGSGKEESELIVTFTFFCFLFFVFVLGMEHKASALPLS